MCKKNDNAGVKEIRPSNTNKARIKTHLLHKNSNFQLLNLNKNFKRREEY